LLAVAKGPAFAVVVGALLLACGGSAPSRFASDEANHPLVGKPALALGGTPIAIGASADSRPREPNAYAGKVVVVDFWATWCEPCRQALPKLDALAAKHSDTLVVIGVSEDDDAAEALPFARKLGLQMPLVFDDGKKAASLWALPPALPVTFVVDRTGVVRGVFVGAEPGADDRISAAVEALLARP
jgi:thiol-disulfide isomerase/thioredoxin